jgi:hypothetical protein
MTFSTAAAQPRERDFARENDVENDAGIPFSDGSTFSDGACHTNGDTVADLPSTPIGGPAHG